LEKIPRWWNFFDSLDLEGVYYDVVLGDNEPKEASSGDAKYTLEGVQAVIVLATPLKDNSQVI
jgi:hypothetical protein